MGRPSGKVSDTSGWTKSVDVNELEEVRIYKLSKNYFEIKQRFDEKLKI